MCPRLNGEAAGTRRSSASPGPPPPTALPWSKTVAELETMLYTLISIFVCACLGPMLQKLFTAANFFYNMSFCRMSGSGPFGQMYVNLLVFDQKMGNKLFFVVYDNEITSLIDIYFLRISFIPSEPF
jgi:hypothetical protein